MDLEYRVIQLSFDGQDIVTNRFDFGCSIIVQDKLKVAQSNPEYSDNIAKLAVMLVEAVLYRMLEGKVVDFDPVKRLKPEVVIDLFFKFQQWYKTDIEYLKLLMDSTKVKGVISPSGGKGSGDDSLYTIVYSFFKIHGLDPEVVMGWKFDTVADMLYMSEMEQVNEQMNKMDIG